MTSRRAFIGVLAGGLLAVPPGAGAQPAGKAYRIGFLGAASPTPSYRTQLEAFRRGLRELGYEEGRNVVIESRWAEGRYERLPALAAELIQLKVDIILTHGTPGSLAAKRATTTIPIVIATVADAVGGGLVASLSRPGGNITGHSLLLSQVSTKKIEILRESLPRVKLLAVPLNPANPANAQAMQGVEDGARALGFELFRVEVRAPDEFDTAFASIAKRGCDAVFLYDDAMFYGHVQGLAKAMERYRWPAIGFSGFPEAGGLMSFSVNYVDLWRRAAVFVDKILKGAKPADLPVEQPTSFELVINLKTARALGVTIAPALLLRADRTIE